jgi:RimJ/RimL family protein N-acetyltransferase
MSEYPPMATHLTTDRLTLRPWTLSDLDDYRSLVAERGAGTPTEANTRERITSQLAATVESGLALLPIIRRTEGDFIGYCGLIIGRTTVAEPEIAYELLQRVHGNGYATEAARAVLDAAIATGRRRLWSTVRAWNARSFRVLEKLGFERDHVTTPDERGDLVWLMRVLP